MTVLVTRPGNAGIELTAYLEQQGIAACHTPLIRFLPGNELNRLIDYIDQLKNGDLVFAVSGNAVNYANQQLCRHNRSWPHNVSYFSVGKATASTLTAVTNCPVYYPDGREVSEHLIELTELSNVSGKQALVLRGNGGRELLGQTLQQRGASVIYCECYQRVAINYDADQLVAAWQSQHVDTIVVTSNEMLQQLYSLVPVNQRHWLTHCKLMVISERIAQSALDFGWQNISIVNCVNNHALIQALA